MYDQTLDTTNSLNWCASQQAVDQQRIFDIILTLGDLERCHNQLIALHRIIAKD